MSGIESAAVQTGPGAHPASCTMGTGYFLKVKSGRGVALIPHLLLVPWSKKSRAIPLLPVWTVRPVQSLSACKRGHFTFTTYLLTPWCRVLLEKLTGLQLVKKFPTFHGTRRFITALTSVRHMSLSWASPIQSIYPHPTSWRSILILTTHLRLGLPSGLFPSGFPTKTLYTPLSSPIRPCSFAKSLKQAKILAADCYSYI